MPVMLTGQSAENGAGRGRRRGIPAFRRPWSAGLPGFYATWDFTQPQRGAKAKRMADELAFRATFQRRWYAAIDRFHAEDGASTAVRVPEAWDPATGRFTIYAAASTPRGYRSTALLLPDGRVWTGGGACGVGCAQNLTAEVFRPPYLFAPDGQLAPRPTIRSAPSLTQSTTGGCSSIPRASGSSTDCVMPWMTARR